MCHDLVLGHGLPAKRRYAHDSAGFFIEARNAAASAVEGIDETLIGASFF